ncbi:MAG: sigma-70 family RNA polymerase sigma factor [Gemmataceae bacterium]|nr:sigma-70 family RNA polymerase sigma factor [Gemmataceae bacterium]MCI0740982.1 sigma-70 family RNA polymerase sigma factor [Gemmataceae bacterium]
MSSESDRLLIQQIRQGDARAWEHLISRYEGRLLAFVQRRLHDRASSEDVVQESFIGFLTSLPNFDDRRELQTYLFTIASHKLTDHLRRTGRHPLQNATEEALNLKLDDNPAASSLARSQERRELESLAVSQCLGALLETWRQQCDYERIKVLELLFVKGWANRDVASILKISEQQVANIRFAAVKKISEQIRDAGLPADVFPELQG